MKLIRRNRNNYKISLWALSALIFYFIFLMIPNVSVKQFLLGDFPHYWAAGRLQVLDQNPYDPELVIQLRNDLGQSIDYTEVPTLMLYPPWILPLLIPFGLLTYQKSWFVWFIVQIVIMIYCTNKTWSLYGGSNSNRRVANIILIFFFPNLFVLLMGHISPLFLLGVVLFLNTIDKKGGSTASDLLAGSSLTVLTIKPQLLILFFLVLLLWLIDRKRWQVMIGMVCTLLTFTIIAITINPEVFNHYLSTLGGYPLGHWATPTLGMVLRYIIGVRLFWLQFIPMMFGVLWMIYYWTKNKNEWVWIDHLPIVILVSVLCSIYGWTYDLTILLLPILHAAVLLTKPGLFKVRNLFLSIFVALNLGVFVIHLQLTDFWFFWFVPVIFVWYFTAIRAAENYSQRVEKIRSVTV